MLEITGSVLGIFIYFFIFWKRLREDYVINQVFSTAFFILFGIGIGSLVSWYFIKDWWFWTVFAGALCGLTFGVIKYGLRVFEILEAGVISLMPWLFLIFFINSFLYENITSLSAGIVIILLIFMFIFFDTRYKTFTWYRSGKAGFSGLTVLGLLFLLRSTVAINFPNVISFVGKIDSMISGVVAFVLFLSLFNLARKTT